jgi:hypothetical protein
MKSFKIILLLTVVKGLIGSESNSCSKASKQPKPLSEKVKELEDMLEVCGEACDTSIKPSIFAFIISVHRL